MTLHAKALQWSLGIHGMLILVVALLQSFAVSQTAIAVIDFTFSDNPPSPVVERTSPHQAPAVKREPKPAAATRPKEIHRKEPVKEKIVKEVVEKEIVKEVEEEQIAPHPEWENARSPSEVSSIPETIPTALPRAVDGPGGSEAEGTGSAPPSQRAGDDVGAPSANRASQDADAANGPTQGTTERLRSAGAAATPESSRAAYLKEHFVYIRERITGSISYPHMARKMGWCGQVRIAFVVCEDGGVSDVRVVESSGFGLLDRNAVETVKHVAPFPSPPVKAEIRMAITYRLN